MTKQRHELEQDDELALDEEVLEDLEAKPDDADNVRGGQKPIASSSVGGRCRG